MNEPREKKETADNLTERRFGGYRFEEALDRYASCIVNLGAALEKGQHLLISALTVHRDAALALSRAAYRSGAASVEILYQDELLTFTQLALGGEASITYLSKSVIAAYEEVIERRGAYIALTGREDLHLFRSVDSGRQSRALLSRLKKLDFFYQNIYNNFISWCVAAGAAPGTAAAVFPGCTTADACAALWDRIFSICRVYEKNPLRALRKHAEVLERRKNRLNGMRLRKLHFKSPTCDFSLCLHDRARWKGGLSKTRDGKLFFANIPTEEVFTVPDWRSLDGFFHSTRPLLYKNIYVPELLLGFHAGQLTVIEGGIGVKELVDVLRADPSNARAGEIALVPFDSKIAETGLVFYDLLYDENAACHIALGAGYVDCLKGAVEMSPGARDEAGFNNASVHIDIMFGSSELSVTGWDDEGRRCDIMEGGKFIEM